MSGSLRPSKTWARSSDRQFITVKGARAPCHFNANPVRRVSVALLVTLQLSCDAPNLRRTTNVRRHRSRSRRRCVPARAMASKGHSVDRVLLHVREVDRADPNAGDRTRRQRDVVVEAAQPPDLNRAAAAALLRIVIQGANREKLVREGEDESVQS